MQRITPFLWFDDQAKAAATFYVSVFKNSKIKTTTHYTGEEPSGRKGSVMTVSFELDGQEFVALNGGPRFKFTQAVLRRQLRDAGGDRLLLGNALVPGAGKKCNAADSRIHTVSPGG